MSLESVGLDAWDDALDGLAHDFYHGAGHHRLARELGEGEPVLLRFEDAGARILLPLLLRPIPDPAGSPQGLRDATSVYGYAGPLVSAAPASLAPATLERFRQEMHDWVRQEGIVSVFSRLHPLLPQAELLRFGQVADLGVTVSIDLTATEAAQVAAYRKTTRREIRALRELGVVCAPTQESAAVDEFQDIYAETMRRVGAADHYLYSRDYLHQLLASVPTMRLFRCVLEGVTVCAALFNHTGGIVQYHLAGTRAAYQRHAPMKLLVDEVRAWATARGASVLHLGGGVGGQEDSLFRFKAGFSDVRHVFQVWRWIADPPRYQALTAAAARSGRSATSGGAGTFFPAYRAP